MALIRCGSSKSINVNTILSDSATAAFAVHKNALYAITVVGSDAQATFTGADNIVIVDGSQFSYELAGAGYAREYVIKANSDGTITTGGLGTFLKQTVYEFI